MPPEESGSQTMSVAQVTSMMKARWKPMVIIALSITIVSALMIKSLPKTYTATAALIVNSDTKDPLAGRDFGVDMATTNYVSTQIELMTSPIVLLPAVDRLHLTQDKDFTAGFGGGAASPAALREFVGKNLALGVTVERGTGGQLIYINASAKSAAKAAQLANTIVDVYMEQDRSRLNGPAGERAQRYVEELSELRNKATLAQDKVTAFRKENGLGDLNSGAGEADFATLDNMHQRLTETQNQRRALEAKLAEPAANATDPLVAGNLQTLKTQLATQLAQLAKLEGTYGPQHPKIRELQGQIAITRQNLSQEQHDASSSNQADLARVRELEDKYKRAITEQEGKVANLRQAHDEGSKLVLELDSAKAVYKQALDGFDQIMFQSVADRTSTSLVSRAVAPLRSSKPNKMKLMAMALMAAIALGVLGPLAYEMFLDRRVRCRDDMEREFGVAVLAQFDTVPMIARAA
jgi:uncharacterized protein involved in exopolysaccharide biosynthesis